MTTQGRFFRSTIGVVLSIVMTSSSMRAVSFSSLLGDGFDGFLDEFARRVLILPPLYIGPAVAPMADSNHLGIKESSMQSHFPVVSSNSRMPSHSLPLAALLAMACSGSTASPGGASDSGATDSGVVVADSRSAGTSPIPFEEWRRREPIYELYVRHFSDEGTFGGVEARLPELKALGVGIVWLMPINAIGSIDPSAIPASSVAHGAHTIDAPFGNPYAVRNFERISPEYGSDGTEASAEADLRSLVDTAHELDMRVIIDWVPNHTAWDNPLIQSHPDWYEWNTSPQGESYIKPVGEDFKWIAQLDWSNQALRGYMTDVMVDWVERFDIDGFRVDFAHHMPLEFFEQLRPALEEIKPVFLLAEASGRAFHPIFDMTYDWSVYPKLGDIAQGSRTVSAIDDALYFEQFVPYLDEPRALQMRMTYNHDDNGNWSLAERYGEGIRAAAVLACTLPGKPMILDGQETGFRVRVGNTIEVGAPLTHDPAVKLDWSDPEGFRPFYTLLLHLHRANSALHQEGFDDYRKVETNYPDTVYSFIRRDGDNQVLVIVNMSATPSPGLLLMPTDNTGSVDETYKELFTGDEATVLAANALDLGPWDYRVYVKGPTQ